MYRVLWNAPTKCGGVCKQENNIAGVCSAVCFYILQYGNIQVIPEKWNLRLVLEAILPLFTGTNVLVCMCAHSSTQVFIGCKKLIWNSEHLPLELCPVTKCISSMLGKIKLFFVLVQCRVVSNCTHTYKYPPDFDRYYSIYVQEMY